MKWFKKIKDMSISELEKHIKQTKFSIFFLLIGWIGISFLSIMYAFAFDPVLAMAVFSFFFGCYTIVIVQFFLYQRTYLFLRKISEQKEKEE